MVIDLLSQAEADIESLEKALDRLATGSYGTCATCGRPVAPERLAAHPTTPVCVACAQVGWPRMRPT